MYGRTLRTCGATRVLYFGKRIKLRDLRLLWLRRTLLNQEVVVEEAVDEDEEW